MFTRNNTPDISVIIPFYNVEEYIGECLDSVIAQEGVKTELILVDDGSTDGSAEIVKSFMRRHDNISLYHEYGKGPSAARNLGVKYAKGRYIAFLDADDLLRKGIYARMIKAAEFYDAEICLCTAARFDQDGKYPSELHDNVFREYKPCTHITETHSLIYDTTVWNKLIDRNFYLDNNIQFPEGVVYEDIYVTADMHHKCRRAAMISEVGYLWRKRSTPGNESITQRFYSEENVRDRFAAITWLMEDFCKRDIPEGLKKDVQRKILNTDMNLIIDAVEHVADDRALQIMGEVKAFIGDYIDDDAAASMPLIDQQKYYYINNGDLEGLRKTLAYRKTDYDKAPVTEREGRLYAELPGELFKIKSRDVTDEFSRIRRKFWVDGVKCSDGGFDIDAHIYLARYNLENPDDQTIMIKLINEETGQILDVDTRPIEAKHITKLRGTVEDPVSGITAKYNYDYSGFTFHIDPSIFDKGKLGSTLKYSVLMEYRDRIFSGQQQLRGVSRDVKAECKKLQIRKGLRKYRINFGYMNELQIMVTN